MSSDDAMYYQWAELEDIPELPGIYAWYLPLFIPGTAKNSASDFTGQLEAYADILKRPKAAVRMKGNLSAKLEGEIKQIPYGQSTHKFSKLLKDNIEHEDSRKELHRILNMISFTDGPDSPLTKNPAGLLSPLYIGVATDLHSRIKSHKKGIVDTIQKIRTKQTNVENYLDVTEKDEDKEDADEEERDRIFAHRIARGLSDNGNRFTSKHLMVYVIPIEQSSTLSESDLRKTIEAAETLLNRVHYPTFGRR